MAAPDVGMVAIKILKKLTKASRKQKQNDNINRTTERQKDRKTERQKDRKTKKQKERKKKTERQKDNKTNKQKQANKQVQCNAKIHLWSLTQKRLSGKFF